MPARKRPDRNNKDDRGEPKSLDSFCEKCGLKISKPTLPGRLTGYMFDLVKCKCGENSPADPNALSQRLYKLKGEGLESLSAQLENGAIVGGVYRIIELIGQGGMGEVYMAEHQTLKKVCALKLIPPEKVTNNTWHRFEQEAKAVAKLEHINIVKVTDLGIHEGLRPYYAMEYVDGESLADLLARRGRLTLAEALPIFLQVCEGLDYAHRAGIIHRDLKPANIMVTNKRSENKISVKVLDFGLAKIRVEDQDYQSLTSVGDIFGSPYYMSPEQCSGEKVDNRSDIYSIGCALFEVLTGRPPFNGNLAAAVIFNHQEAHPPTLESVVGAGLPESMEIVMAKLLRKNPVERYQTCRELSVDLQRVGRGETVLPVYASRTAGDAGRDPRLPPNSAAAQARSRLEQSKNKTVFVIASVGTVMLAMGALVIFARSLISNSPLISAPATQKTVSPSMLKDTPALMNSTYLTYKEAHPALARQSPPAAGKPPDDGGMAESFNVSLANVVDTSLSSARSLPTTAKSTESYLSGKLINKIESAGETAAFSTKVDKNGIKLLKFAFPVDTVIGAIGDGARDQFVPALGDMVFALPSKLVFAPSQAAMLYPRYFRRFRPGDISGFGVAGRLEPNRVIKLFSSMPGYEKITALHLYSDAPHARLSADTLHILNQCHSIDSFVCQESALGGTDIRSFTWLTKVQSLRLIDFHQCGPILDIFVKINTLRVLGLVNCKLLPSDRRAVAALTAVQDLDLRDSLNSAHDLEVISANPSIHSLSIAGNVVSDLSLPLVLKKFKNLRILNIFSVTEKQKNLVSHMHLSGVRISAIERNISTESLLKDAQEPPMLPPESL